MTPILLKDLSKRFGSTIAVEGLTLQIRAGELFFLLGPSGCGKTTLLRMLAGFVQPDAGDIYFGEKAITHLPPRLREAGMVFQTYALWPHMTVAKNVAYGLQVRGLGRKEIAQRVERALRLVHLEGLGERKPGQLSGGQQQRVALARALVIEPRVLLLDEPLSNLDARLREEMREEIRRVHQETGLTMLYVTHDQKEALALADRLAVMDKGQLVQAGTPAELYQKPATRFVASFLGDANFVPGKVTQTDVAGCTVETVLGPLLAGPRDGIRESSRVVCSIRPQAINLNTTGTGPNRFTATVNRSAFLGELMYLQMTAGDTSLMMAALPQTCAHLKPGDTIVLSVAPDQVIVLPDAN